jgi:FkbM family methyltransferase
MTGSAESAPIPNGLLRRVGAALIRNGLRAMGFERWVVRPISRARFRALTANVARVSALTANLDQATQTIEHLRRIEAAYRQTVDAADKTTQLLSVARRGVQAMINELQRMLFEVTGNTGPSEAATILVLADQPVTDSVATLINLSEAFHGARPFQIAMPILAPTRPFPLPWRSDLPALRIVDVGSQELASESDMHAPLRAVAPVEIIGFDPFAPSTGTDASVEVTRGDGARIKTFPVLLADGGPVTFHVNRYDPTSSILPSNHPLTRQFGLLDLAVETVETRVLSSRRMDDMLPTGGEAARVDLLKIDVQGAAHTVLESAAKILRNTLVCHVEIEFAPVYLGEKLFGDIDTLLRAAGFCFVDFFNLGRQRYASFDTSPARAFHRGRTLWGDCIYIRDLDREGALSAADLFRAALIAHSCYNKQDLAAELLRRFDGLEGTELLRDYIIGAPPAGTTA